MVTAAAGTGIGFATARRCIEEGATVVISDAHERRLGEAADELAPLAGDPARCTLVCDVTVEDQVQAHGRRRGRRARTASTWWSTTPGSAARPTLVDMTDEQWNKVLDVTLTGTFRCTRAALRHMYDQARRA